MVENPTTEKQGALPRTPAPAGDAWDRRPTLVGGLVACLFGLTLPVAARSMHGQRAEADRAQSSPEALIEGLIVAWGVDDRERLAELASGEVVARLAESELFRPTAATPPLRADALQLDQARELGDHRMELSGTLPWNERRRRLTATVREKPNGFTVVGIRWGE